jgi:hypothetical protein
MGQNSKLFLEQMEEEFRQDEIFMQADIYEKEQLLMELIEEEQRGEGIIEIQKEEHASIIDKGTEAI